MEKKIAIIVIIAVLVILLIIATYRNHSASNGTPAITPSITATPQVKDFCHSSVQDIITQLTPEDKIRQLIVPAFSYNGLQSLENISEEYGAYILIDSLKYKNEEQLKTDLDKLKDYNKIPPFLGVDAEGGIVRRFSWFEFTHLSKLKNSANLCQDIESEVQFLKRMGFNWSLVPVVDTPYSENDWIYSRTIDLDPEVISATALAYVNCLQSQGISTTAKHFPGHGDTLQDSHYDVPEITHTVSQWASVEKYPFEQLINNNIDFVMTGHIIYSSINPEIASISNYWINDILRNEMHFNNIVVTDDLNMLHPDSTQACANLVIEALNNGNDMALFVNSNICNYTEILPLLKDKITDIDTHLERVIHVKQERFCSNQ